MTPYATEVVKLTSEFPRCLADNFSFWFHLEQILTSDSDSEHSYKWMLRQSTTSIFGSGCRARNTAEVKRDWNWEMLGSLLITHLYSSTCLRNFKSEESRDSAMAPGSEAAIKC